MGSTAVLWHRDVAHVQMSFNNSGTCLFVKYCYFYRNQQTVQLYPLPTKNEYKTLERPDDHKSLTKNR